MLVHCWQVSPEDESALLSMIEAAGRSAAQVKGLAIMGSLPPGVSRDFYAKVRVIRPPTYP